LSKFRVSAALLGGGAGGDSLREQKNAEARKMLENAAESPASSAPTHDGTHHISQKNGDRSYRLNKSSSYNRVTNVR